MNKFKCSMSKKKESLTKKSEATTEDISVKLTELKDVTDADKVLDDLKKLGFYTIEYGDYASKDTSYAVLKHPNGMYAELDYTWVQDSSGRDSYSPGEVVAYDYFKDKDEYEEIHGYSPNESKKPEACNGGKKDDKKDGKAAESKKSEGVIGIGGTMYASKLKSLARKLGSFGFKVSDNVEVKDENANDKSAEYNLFAEKDGKSYKINVDIYEGKHTTITLHDGATNAYISHLGEGSSFASAVSVIDADSVKSESKKSEDASSVDDLLARHNQKWLVKVSYDVDASHSAVAPSIVRADTKDAATNIALKRHRGLGYNMKVVSVEPMNEAHKKSESLTLKQKELKDMARYGEAEDITTISDAEAKELKKKGIETVGISRGVYGMNGVLLRDNEGNKYVITARSSNLFYFV